MPLSSHPRTRKTAVLHLVADACLILVVGRAITWMTSSATPQELLDAAATREASVDCRHDRAPYGKDALHASRAYLQTALPQSKGPQVFARVETSAINGEKKRIKGFDSCYR